MQEVTLPTLGSLSGIGAEWDGHELFYGFSSYTVPPSVYRLDFGGGASGLWRRRSVVQAKRYRPGSAVPVSALTKNPTIDHGSRRWTAANDRRRIMPSSRTLTIEKASVTTRSAIAIADA